ncbi:hypothetical protein VTI74DRAFT_9467 [Chaetomium olivicolor]
MGNFGHISSVAKYAARLGQCFSTTRLLRCIAAPNIVNIPDVERGGFCFTDGVGKISELLACLISEDWDIHPAPSAFQFRMGGCKGVLVTWPEAKGLEVHIRPSQEKFYAEYNSLEIIRCSQFSCATLNRQTILILSCLGVPDDVFTDMMRQQLSNYDLAMTDKDKALELLTSYVDENMTSKTIATMLLDGFMHTREPFVRSLLQLWRAWSIKGLREKARLIVDQGAFVLGCVDETGTLRGHSKLTEGRSKITRDQLPQIFLQVPDPKDRGTYKIITGLCLIGRNPSLHPGDIRVVEAVDVPQLRHIRDVVVFPLHGDRDVPSMCSGGDLDGDDFFVIWDPKLLPTEWSHPPMSYTAPKVLIEPKASSAKSLASFFVLYMKNDRLPLIAHAHLATADYEVDGAKHRKCLQLAELHSTAVDYVKTGIPAKWTKKLDPRRYPHFMEKAKNRSYHSTSVLGKLFDMVDKDAFDNHENYRLPFDDRILKRFHLDNSLLKEARKIKSQYDIAMRRIMGQLEIRTEFEVYTTFVLSKPRVGTDYKTQEKVGRETACLKKQFRDLCLKTVDEHSFDRLQFVAAMYRVTWEETRIALYEARQKHVLPDGTVGLRKVSARSMPLISFPWLFPHEMGQIATGAEKRPNSAEIRANPQQVMAVKPRTKELVVEMEMEMKMETDLEGMDYTKTSDGQYVHLGEILHLFRHDDEREEGFYLADDGFEGAEPPVGSEEEKEADEFPLLLEFETPLDGNTGTSSGSDVTSPNRKTASSTPKAASPQPARNLTLLDLRSADMNEGSDSPPCLTPTKTYAQEPVSITDPARSVTHPYPCLTPVQVSSVTCQDATAYSASPASNSTETPMTVQKVEWGMGANKDGLESVVSGCNGSSWDRVTSPAPESSSSGGLELMPSVSSAQGTEEDAGRWPVSDSFLISVSDGTAPSASELGRGSCDNMSSASLNSYIAGGGRLSQRLGSRTVVSTGPRSYIIGGRILDEIRSRESGGQGDGSVATAGPHSHSSCMGGSFLNQNLIQSQGQRQVAGDIASAGETASENTEMKLEKLESEEEQTEYEEEIIEVEGETALERAARLAST